MRESKFIFDSVDLLCYHLQKTSLKRGGLHIYSPTLLFGKKSNSYF